MSGQVAVPQGGSATWSNWSGGVVATPREIVAPATEEALVGAVRAGWQERTPVRVVGSGHSFVPLCATDGTLISLAGLQGVIATEPETGRATVWAGSTIAGLGAPLLDAGLALANQGDIDTQALAGAIATGTHGTGATLGSLSTQVVGLRLILADGATIDCSAEDEPEIFGAARIALGLFGVIARITVQAVPAYRLHERTWIAGVAETFDRLDGLTADNRHCEFFWVPQEDVCVVKTLNLSEAMPQIVAAAPAAHGRLARYVGPERIDWSYRIFPSERTVLFNEMEYAVPVAHGPDCFHELRQMMRQRHPEVAWPIEYRTLRADDIPLSPAYGRDVVTLSVHQAAGLPYRALFADAEAIFRNHHGRPHWGKIHSRIARDLRDLYPQWDQFLHLRERLDPAGRFLNDYLRELLGVG